MIELLPSTHTAQRLNGDTWSHLLARLQRGGAYGYWWTLDEVKRFTIKRGPRAGQQEKCKRTYWWPSAKPPPIPSGETEHVYFGVHPAVGIPQERSGREGPYTPKPESARPLVGEIAAVNCLFAEFDAKDFAEGKPGARAHTDGLALTPLVLIDSGGGYHAYWLLDEPFIITDDSRTAIKALQNRWVEYVEADEESKDLARMLRVPGRRNVKAKYGPDFPLVAFVSVDFDRLYTVDELAAAIPPEITATEARDIVPFTPSAGDHSAYVQAAYDGEIAAVLAALPGQKHPTLRNAAIKLASCSGLAVSPSSRSPMACSTPRNRMGAMSATPIARSPTASPTAQPGRALSPSAPSWARLQLKRSLMLRAMPAAPTAIAG
jgi:hypothetical protein